MVLRTHQSTGRRTVAAPSERVLQLWVWPLAGFGLLTDLGSSICETLRNARAPRERVLYGHCCMLYMGRGQGVGPRLLPFTGHTALYRTYCPLQDIVRYLKYLFDVGRAASTLKVHMAAISFNHGHIAGRPFRARYWVSQFLSGTRRPRPPRRAAAWDLPLVLQALGGSPFEPMAGVTLRNASMKTAFLLAITMAKRTSANTRHSVSFTFLKNNFEGCFKDRFVNAHSRSEAGRGILNEPHTQDEISGSNCPFHLRQTRKRAQWAKHVNVPLTWHLGPRWHRLSIVAPSVDQ